MTWVPEPGWVHITRSLTSLEQTHGLRPERILLSHLPKTLGGFLPHSLRFSSINPALKPPQLLGVLLPEHRAGMCACVRGPLSPASCQPGGSSPGCSPGLPIWEHHTPLQTWRTCKDAGTGSAAPDTTWESVSHVSCMRSCGSCPRVEAVTDAVGMYSYRRRITRARGWARGEPCHPCRPDARDAEFHSAWALIAGWCEKDNKISSALVA